MMKRNAFVKLDALLAFLNSRLAERFDGFYLDLSATLKFLPRGWIGKVPKNFKFQS
jgi:hypothetical protein